MLKTHKSKLPHTILSTPLDVVSILAESTTSSGMATKKLLITICTNHTTTSSGILTKTSITPLHLVCNLYCNAMSLLTNYFTQTVATLQLLDIVV